MPDNLPVPTDDDLPVVNIGFRPGVRPKLSDPKEVEQAISNYFDTCDKHIIYIQKVSKGEIVRIPTPEPYTIMGLSAALGIDRHTINGYNRGEHANQDEDYQAIHSMIIHARERVRQSHVALSLAGVYESKIAALIMSGDMGYSTKTESINININRDMTDDELDASIGRILGISET